MFSESLGRQEWSQNEAQWWAPSAPQWPRRGSPRWMLDGNADVGEWECH